MNTTYTTSASELIKTGKIPYFTHSGLQKISEYSDFTDMHNLSGVIVPNTTITHNGTETILTAAPVPAGSAAGSFGGQIVMESLMTTKYVANTVSESSITVRLPVSASADTNHPQYALWGLYTGFYHNAFYSSGYGFGMDNLGVHTFRYAATGDTKTHQFQWPDKLDGSGASGLTLNINAPNRFIIRTDPSEYIDYAISMPTSSGYKTVTVLREFPTKVKAFPDEPCVPWRVIIYNGDLNHAFYACVGGRSHKYLGDFSTQTYAGSHGLPSVSGISNTSGTLPLMSLRKTQSAGYIMDNVAVYMIGFEFICTVDCSVTLYRNTFLNKFIWGQPNGAGPAESAVECDTTATSFVGGDAIYKALVRGSAGDGYHEFPQPIPVTRLEQITLCARTIPTSSTATSASFRIKWIEKR